MKMNRTDYQPIGCATKTIVVDDDAVTRFLISSALHEYGFEVFECGSAEALFDVLEKQRVDVIILDMVLPKVNGLDALSYVREQSDVGVIMISSHANAQQRLHGLREGADDFITKPVITNELVLKVKSLATRVNHQRGEAEQPSFVLGNCLLQAEERKLANTEYDTHCLLTASEQRLLIVLLQHQPQICSRKQLLQCIHRSEISLGNDRSLDTLISRIRAKLRKLNCSLSVLSVRGQGYVLQR